jgi:glycine/D-amino acid oxidase-like deaminating enzyme
MAPRVPTAYERNAPDVRIVRDALAGSEHRVFWLDDAEPAIKHPVLRTTALADLVVIGAGYLGLWTAIAAKRRHPDRSVIVLESESVGWAASGRNGGFCEASITHGEENGRSRWPDEYDQLERLGLENLAAFEADTRTLQLDCEWERRDLLAVAVEEHQLGWLAGSSHLLDASATRDRINSPLFLGAVAEPDICALVHPAKLVYGLARAASELGVQIFEQSPAMRIRQTADARVQVETARTVVTARKVALATNAFPSLLRRNRLRTIPVYDYVLMTEPLTAAQRESIGWSRREGLTDLANQFHYSRLTADNRILYGGYDAVYHPGGRIRPSYEERPETYERLASHLLATFPQLEGIRFTHRWAGVIDTSTQFSAFYGRAMDGAVAYAAGFTGLGVGATRFAADVLNDLLDGDDTERTRLEMVRRKPTAFPPEPLATAGIALTRWSLDQADHQHGKRNPFLRALDAVGLGFES